MTASIRPWRTTDRPELRAMLGALLETTYAAGADLRPTAHNVDRLTEIGLAWSSVAQPTLVLLVDGTPVGFTLWGELGSGAGLELRDRSCVALGTYIAPGYRRRGYATALRREAMRLAKRCGYDRVQGAVFDPAAKASAEAAGMIPTGAIVEAVLA